MTEEEERVLAWTVLGEAAGEGNAGMAAVLHVIRNRSNSGRFPDNPAAVAMQGSNRPFAQFSTWNNGGNGGNQPRARYPVGSSAFQNALSVVRQVFGPNPGIDPTRGATHYYSPKGMIGGKEPYWWKSEAPRGGLTIGGHIFAVKRAADAPVPQARPGTGLGQFPGPGALQVLRTGKPVLLPDIGIGAFPSSGQLKVLKDGPVRLPEIAPSMLGGTEKVIAVFDTVTGQEVRRVSTSAQQRIVQQKLEQQQQRLTANQLGTASKSQQVAGFSVNGTGTIAQVDRDRRRALLAAQVPSMAGQDRDGTGYFGPDIRLAATGGLPAPRRMSGGLSRDAVDLRRAGEDWSRPPLEILVDGSNTIQPDGVPLPLARPKRTGPILPFDRLNRAPIPFKRPQGGVAPVPFNRPKLLAPVPFNRPVMAPVPFDRPEFGMGGPMGTAQVARAIRQTPRPPQHTGKIAALVTQGYTAQAAYTILNTVARGPNTSVEDRVSGSSTSSGGGADSLSSI